MIVVQKREWREKEESRIYMFESDSDWTVLTRTNVAEGQDAFSLHPDLLKKSNEKDCHYPFNFV